MWEHERAKGNIDRARHHAQKAGRREPEKHAVQELSGLLESASLQTDAPHVAEIVQSRVRALLQEGRHERAISLLQSAVRSGPYDESLHYTLGNLMLAHEPPQKLIQFFSQEIGRDDKP